MTKKTYVTTVAFVGQPNVGKSTLLNALVGTKIAPTSRKPQTTRRIIRGIKTVDNCQQIYFDTPGALRTETGLDQFMHDQISAALTDVDQVVAIVDAQDFTRKHVAFINKVKVNAVASKQPLTLVINKIDALKDKKKVLELIAAYAQECEITEIVPISATLNDGLSELFKVLAKNAPEAEFIFSDELFTDSSEKDIVAELVREKAMLELTDELPYKIAVTVEHFDESRRENEKKSLIEIEAVLHVERKSQKAIVVGKGGESIKRIGIRARKDLEHLLNCQVMLRLFVRVEPNWTTSPKGLKKLGY